MLGTFVFFYQLLVLLTLMVEIVIYLYCFVFFWMYIVVNYFDVQVLVSYLSSLSLMVCSSLMLHDVVLYTLADIHCLRRVYGQPYSLHMPTGDKSIPRYCSSDDPLDIYSPRNNIDYPIEHTTTSPHKTSHNRGYRQRRDLRRSLQTSLFERGLNSELVTILQIYDTLYFNSNTRGVVALSCSS